MSYLAHLDGPMKFQDASNATYENIDMQNCALGDYDEYEVADKTENFTKYCDQILHFIHNL
jgi:hypothetical protein